VIRTLELEPDTASATVTFVFTATAVKSVLAPTLQQAVELKLAL
jgi:hypothetical protein